MWGKDIECKVRRSKESIVESLNDDKSKEKGGSVVVVSVACIMNFTQQL